MGEMVHCFRCEATYQRGDWLLVAYRPGTTGDYQVRGRIDPGCCPICRIPPLTEKPVEWSTAL